MQRVRIVPLLGTFDNGLTTVRRPDKPTAYDPGILSEITALEDQGYEFMEVEDSILYFTKQV